MIVLSSVIRFALKKKKSKNRHKLEIVRDVLSAATVKKKKTRIMYQANLSYILIEKYLRNLLDNGLVTPVEGSFYLITKKGRHFLEMYGGYIERCVKIGDEVHEARKHKERLEDMCFNTSPKASSPSGLR